MMFLEMNLSIISSVYKFKMTKLQMHDLYSFWRWSDTWGNSEATPVTPSTVALSVISMQTPCCVCHNIRRSVVIQNLYLSLCPTFYTPSLSPLSSSTSSQRALPALAQWCQPVCLHFPCHHSGSLGSDCPVFLHIPQYVSHTHTLHVHSLQPGWCHYVSARGYQPAPTGGGGLGEGGRWRNRVAMEGGEGAWMHTQALRLPDAAN